MTGSTAFFAPLIFTVPLNRLPPFIISLSKISVLLKLSFQVSAFGSQEKSSST